MTDTQAKVVKAMAENQLNMSRAAKALHYHKTNIYKHVIRVLDQTGKDMRDFYDMNQLLMEAEVVLGTARGKRYAHLMDQNNQEFSGEFGVVLICAVRYCIDYKSHYPKMVMDVIRPLIPCLKDNTLSWFEKDIEDADRCRNGIDKMAWTRFLSEVKAEIARRNESADGE